MTNEEAIKVLRTESQCISLTVTWHGGTLFLSLSKAGCIWQKGNNFDTADMASGWPTARSQRKGTAMLDLKKCPFCGGSIKL